MVKPWFDTTPVIPSESWLKHLKLNFYVNSKGEVFRKNRSRPIGSLNSDGYLQCVLRMGKEYRNFKVHILAYFLANGVFPAREIHHCDNCRTNNSKDNLIEVTREENLKYRKNKNIPEPF